MLFTPSKDTITLTRFPLRREDTVELHWVCRTSEAVSLRDIESFLQESDPDISSFKGHHQPKLLPLGREDTF